MTAGRTSRKRGGGDLKQGVREYLDIADSSDALFQGSLRSIQEEMRIFGDKHDEVDERAAWNGLGETFAHKIPSVGMCRWFAYTRAAKVFLGIWTRRFTIICYLCMVTGRSLKGLFDMVPIRLAKRKPGEDIAKATTQNDREDVQKARGACGSTMNFAAGCMSNRFHWKINVVIVHLASAVDKGFADANKNNRSCTQSAAYWSERTVDKGLPEINEITAAMAAREVYENTGCHVYGVSALPLQAGRRRPHGGGRGRRRGPRR